MARNSNNISGIAVALGFLVTGLVTAFLAKQLLPLNTIVSAVLITLGVVGFFIEVEKELGNKGLGMDNSGIGLLLLAIGFGVVQLSPKIDNTWGKHGVGIIAVLILVFGFSGTADGLYKLFKFIFSRGINASSVIKTIGLIIPLASSVLALLKQANIL